MAELFLDPDIRIWVILPIFFITLLFGLLRHYAEQYLASEPENTVEKVKDSQMLMRSRILRMNGGYISKDGFSKRKFFLNDSEDGFLKQARESPPPMGMGDPSMATDMMKNMFMNVLPMVLLGGWISWAFSGFVITKVPFPLTLKFKPMLQRGIELTSLNASWVSSISWYFLNFFGLRSIFTLILGSDNRADQSRRMAEMQMNPTMGKRVNMSQMFKDEWEALQVVQYKDHLGDEGEGLLGRGRGKKTPLSIKKRQ